MLHIQLVSGATKYLFSKRMRMSRDTSSMSTHCSSSRKGGCLEKARRTTDHDGPSAPFAKENQQDHHRQVTYEGLMRASFDDTPASAR